MATNSDVVSWGTLTGAVLAGLMSWFKWHSVFMALIHAFLGG